MNDHERRIAGRLAFELPATVRTATSTHAQGVTRDVSRTGARVRVPCRALGITPTLNLATTAQAVRDRFGDALVLTLRHPVLERTVERATRIARIALPLDAPDSVELGLGFDEDLHDADAAQLGLTLPAATAAGTDAADADAAGTEPAAEVAPDLAPMPSGFGMAAKRGYRAFLTSTAPEAPPSLPCHGDNLSREAVRVRMPREGFAGVSTAESTVRFAQAYGTRLTLKLVDVHKHLWTGPVRLCAVEMPRERPDDMLLTLAFERRLRPAELRRLGLDRGAA